MKKRHYNNGDGEFILEPLSDSPVKVTRQDQTGHFGVNRNWDVRYPYTFATSRSEVSDSGIDGLFSRSTLESALPGRSCGNFWRSFRTECQAKLPSG